jgi:hypothetical protein
MLAVVLVLQFPLVYLCTRQSWVSAGGWLPLLAFFPYFVWTVHRHDSTRRCPACGKSGLIQSPLLLATRCCPHCQREIIGWQPVEKGTRSVSKAS